MNRRFLTQITALALAVGLAGLARPEAADPRPSLKIVLHVSDDERIPPNVISRAKAEMTRIFRYAGIDVVWTKQAPSAAGPNGAHSLTSPAPQVTLSILSREITDELIVATTALGATPSTREYRAQPLPVSAAGDGEVRPVLTTAFPETHSGNSPTSESSSDEEIGVVSTALARTKSATSDGK